MNRTKIPWATYTWNPIVGCSPASEGCANCYAEGISKRFHRPWGSAHFMPERLAQPSHIRKPSRVFVCSMSDIFHPTVEPGMIVAILDEIRQCPQHTFIILTKRPRRLTEPQLVLPGDRTVSLGSWFDEPNIWLGVTVENQARAEERIPLLLTVPAAVRFVSVEPMLEPVDLSKWLIPEGDVIDWVIAGPETGRGKRHCENKWIDDLAAQSPCFFDKRSSFKRREYPI